MPCEPTVRMQTPGIGLLGLLAWVRAVGELAPHRAECKIMPGQNNEYAIGTSREATPFE